MGIYQKMGRRWISLLLVFLMVFSLVPVDELMQVFAAEKPAITVGWKPQKKEVPSGENGEITLKVEIDPAQVEDVGLQIRLTEEEAAAFVEFTKNEDGVLTYEHGDHVWTLEKEPEGDWNFWLLSLKGTVESHTLEEKFTVCMPKSADDQTIDVDSETDVILSYNGKSDSRYTDSDPVKSTASNSSASGNTKNIMTDENGIKISIETVPIRFLAVELTETAVPEVSAAQEKLACVDGVENPDAVFEMKLPDAGLTYHASVTLNGDLSFPKAAATSSNALYRDDSGKKLAEIVGLSSEMKVTEFSADGDTLKFRIVPVSDTADKSVESDETGDDDSIAVVKKTVDFQLKIDPDSLVWAKKQEKQGILELLTGNEKERLRATEDAEVLKGSITLRAGAEGGADAEAVIRISRAAGGGVTVLRRQAVLGPQTVFWIDNGNNDEGIRPSEIMPELSYKLVAQDADWGDGDGTKLEPGASLAGVGLTEMPQPAITKNEGNSTWQISYSNLPSTVVKNGSEYRVLWKWSQPAVDGYERKEINDDNIGEYEGTVDQCGWYYLIRRTVILKTDIRQGYTDYYDITKDEAARYFKLCIYQVTSGGQVSENPVEVVRIDDLLENGTLKLIGDRNAKGDGEYVIDMGWRYNLDGNPFVYTIEWAGDTDENGNPLNRFRVDGMEEGDYIQISYDNSATVGYQERTDRLYSGGTLVLTLTGTRGYEATKIWAENRTDVSEDERPEGEFELWRYPQRHEDYTKAAPVYGEDGKTMSLPLDRHPENNTQEIRFGYGENGEKTLPKYDTDGYAYAYVTKEYFTNDDSRGYEQLFGAYNDQTGYYDDVFIKGDGTRVSTENKDGKRADVNNIYLYDGGTLYNRKIDTVTVPVSKTWEAAAFQENLQDVKVTFGLQSRIKEQKDPDGNTVTPAGAWTEVPGEELSLDGFNAVNVTRSGSRTMPKYDIYGNELEYRFVEREITQNGIRREIEYPEGSENGTFTLTQNGRQVAYESICETASASDAENRTVIVNRIKDTVDYDVVKNWEGNPPAGATLKFRLYRLYSGTSVADMIAGNAYLTFEVTENGGRITDFPTDEGSENIGICVPEQADPSAWSHVRIYGLPEFDRSGHQYEYMLIEEEPDGYHAADIRTEKFNGNLDYRSTLTNAVGTGNDNRILVMKEWLDDGDIQHRRNVAVQAYQNGTGKPVGLPVILGPGSIWYIYVDLGTVQADDVYILETEIYGTDSEESQFTVTNPQISSVSDYDGAYGSVDLKHHRYEVSYKKTKIGKDPVFVVKNRRIAQIDIDVEKRWNDGSGALRDAMKNALDIYNAQHTDASLELSMYLDFDDPAGTASGGQITRKAGNEGDTILVDGHNVETIYDSDRRESAKSVQTMSLESHQNDGSVIRSDHYAFYGVPKYNAKGQVIRYQVKEAWVTKVTEEGTPVYQKVSDVKSILEAIPAQNPVTGATESNLWDLWSTYLRTTSETYTVALDAPENQEVTRNDHQVVTVSNSLSGVKTVHWKKQWNDAYSREQNTRPDIYLTILKREADADGNLKKELSPSDVVVKDYRWVKTDQDSDEQHWTATIRNLPKYNAQGYEIYYYAFERTEVDSNALDYAIAQYAVASASNPDKTDIIGTSGGVGKPGDESYAPYSPDDIRVVLNPIDQSGRTGLPEYAGKYAVVEEGTIINSLLKDARILGSKSYKSLPNNYPAKDYPEITFVLDQYLGTPGPDRAPDRANISELTVKDWTTITKNADGSYPIEISRIGKYVYQLAADGNTGETVPVSEDQTPGNGEELPRYDENGERYTYVLREKSVKGADGKELLVGAADAAVGGMGLYVRDDDGSTTASHVITNTYEGPKGKLKVRKLMKLSKNGDKVTFPAVKFELTRSYTSYADGTPKVVEDTGFAKQVKILSSAEVQAAYEAAGAQAGAQVSLECVFDNLDLYAPNGTDYLYTVTELKDGFLEGFDTWAVKGDYTSFDQVATASNAGIKVEHVTATASNASGGNGMTTESLAAKVGQVISGLFGRSSAGNTEIPAAATFANRKWNTPQEDGKDKVQLVLTKNWADFNAQFGTRPDTLELTLERKANAQPGQSNAIDWTTVTDSTPTEDKSVINQWKYIWSGLDRYAPNGMPWIYRVSEEKPAAYQASGNGSVQFGSTGNPSQTAEITNSLQTTAKFTKQWTDKAGKTVTNDYLGYDLTASFKLQAATSSDASFDAGSASWMDADALFTDENARSAILNANEGNPSADWSERIAAPSLTGKINAAVWKNGKTVKLPAAMKENGTLVYLHYRYVETGVSYKVPGETPDTATQTVTRQADGSYLITGNGLLQSVTDTVTSGTSTITNRTNLKDFSVSKVWSDNDNAYGTRSVQTQMILFFRAGENEDWKLFTISGNPVIVTLSESNGWSTSISGLPGECEYRMRELPLTGWDGSTWIDDGGTFTGGTDYQVSYNDQADSTTVTNTLKTNPDPDDGAKKITLYVEKTWGGTENAPITLKLQHQVAEDNEDHQLHEDKWADVGTKTYAMDGTADASGNGAYWEFDSWKFKITNLPAFRVGKAISYRVIEVVPDGFVQIAQTERTITDTEFDPAGTRQTASLFTFVNAKKNSFKVTKKWVGPSPSAAEVTVSLHRKYRKAGENETEEPVDGTTVQLNEANHFEAEWKDLPETSADGDVYSYYAKEVNDPAVTGYRAEYGAVEAAADGTWKQTVYNIPLTSVSGTKVWKDEKNADGLRPGTVGLILERSTDSNAWKKVDIDADGSTVSLTWDQTTDPDQWTYRFDGLDLYSIAGEKYQYRVTEEPVTGYHAVYTGSNALYAGDRDTIINTKIGEHTFVFDKVWTDAGTSQRPEQIMVRLCRKTAETSQETVDGVAPVIVKNGDLWTYTYEDLPSYDADGRAYTYWVTEDPVNGYDTVYSSDDRAENGGRITNVARGGLAVKKTVSGNRGERNRKFLFTITLSGVSQTGIDAATFTDGNFENGVSEISLKDGEEYRFEEIPAGFSYTVTEADDALRDGYTVTATGTSGTIPAGDTAEAAFENRKNEDPTVPTQPTTPTDPSGPTTPVTPTRPWHHDSDDPEETDPTKRPPKMPTGQSTEIVTETDPAGTTSPDETLESRTETTSSETETNIEETTTAETVTESGTEPDHDDRDNPKTGDSTHTWIWAVLMILSAFGAIMLHRVKKDDENEEHMK